MKKLPIGVQDYKKLIIENYIYIDKTKYILELANSGVPTFLSRPRRFGKSLTVSTLYYLFKGEKELFKDTYIYDKWEFKEYPVIKLDMSDNTLTTYDEFIDSLNERIEELYREYDISPIKNNLPTKFGHLITELSKKYKEKTVILIDEYE
ncbi:ATPase AAA, partial [Marinitoga sp. 1154]|uniref:AAA family ATPase n=1 Tax=Marinitoga sp. 1154 TaxID=1643335 RepID=UPI001585F9DE